MTAAENVNKSKWKDRINVCNEIFWYYADVIRFCFKTVFFFNSHFAVFSKILITFIRNCCNWPKAKAYEEGKGWRIQANSLLINNVGSWFLILFNFHIKFYDETQRQQDARCVTTFHVQILPTPTLLYISIPSVTIIPSKRLPCS